VQSMNNPELSGARLFQYFGRESGTMILLSPSAAVTLSNRLADAAASAGEIDSFAWPKQVASYVVASPTPSGVEHTLSFHLDVGRDSISAGELKRRRVAHSATFLFALIGLIAAVRWLYELLS
jgi:hypothetical protein